jgi:hypothetical protein
MAVRAAAASSNPQLRTRECTGSGLGLHPHRVLTKFYPGPSGGMADAADSKSAEGNLVRVRLSPRAHCGIPAQPQPPPNQLPLSGSSPSVTPGRHFECPPNRAHWRGVGVPAALSLGSHVAYIPAMVRRRLLRLKALVVASVILSGGGGTPVLDAMLYHRLAPTHVNQPHYEACGAPHSHGDRCTLGSRLPYAPQAEAIELGPVVAIQSSSEIVFPSSATPSNDPALWPPARSPPQLPS